MVLWIRETNRKQKCELKWSSAQCLGELRGATLKLFIKQIHVYLMR